MARKKTTKRARSGNSARTVRGKPFKKGHAYAWKPGESGNPSGRPRDTITPHLREMVRRKYPGKGERTYGELIAEALVKRAVRGDVRAIAEVFDRLEGRPRQALDVTADTTDWQELARANGLNIKDVIDEARQIIAAYDAGGDESGDQTPA